MTKSPDASECFQLYLQAGSESISPSELACLVQSCHIQVRVRVAENPRTPTTSILLLASDESPDVRLAVASNSTTPLDLLRRLANDQDPTVRYGIAEDHNVAREILDELISDENPYVCARAAKTIRTITVTERVVECHPRFLPEIPRAPDSREESVS